MHLRLPHILPSLPPIEMADKSTAIPVGICEDVPVVVADVTILTDYVILNIPEDVSVSASSATPSWFWSIDDKPS